MAISPLIPAAGVAAGGLALRAAKSLSGGVSFADVFRRADQAQAPPGAPGEVSGKSKEAASPVSDPRQLLSEFQDLLRRKMAAAGINVSQPMELRTSGNGRVQVSGDHPDWPRIEALFDDDPSLRSALQNLADAFSRQNQNDGRRFQLTLAGDQASVSFV